MFANISSDWKKILKKEFVKPYFGELEMLLEEEYANHLCFPEKSLLLNAFNTCSFKDIKVVIIGQDPYHGEGEANGLAFSVNDGVKIPPSLRNIFREISTDFETIFQPTSGNLENWAKQGVLLLNATLSVRKDTPNSHKHLQWQTFTDAVIQTISDEKEDIVFLLWGNFAQKKAKLIDANKHLILTSGHPSPMSANQGKWFANKHFSKTNNYLESTGKQKINW